MLSDRIRTKPLVALLALLVFAPMALADDVFPRPPELAADIDFWRRVFAEIDSNQAFLHDNRYLEVVYTTINIPADASDRDRRRIADDTREQYREILEKLGKGKRRGLNAEQKRVMNLWPKGTSSAEFKEASRRIRFQQGLSDRFRAGLQRSGAWKSYIESQLNKHSVPTGLAALPHVESSFNPEARSHVGASGLWQFTRGTGVRYMTIDNVVDERRDPYRSSEAAAELLAYNYSILQSWPLAITAYNHGVSGMRRSVQKMGTENFVTINRQFDGPTFGFASRNFYVAFLAALEVEQNAEQYFGVVTRDNPQSDTLVKTTRYIPAEAMADATGISVAALKMANPALLEPVWSGGKYIPRNYTVRIPTSLSKRTAKEILAAIPEWQLYASQTPDQYHKVQRGESLSVIAARYNTPVSELVALNDLKSKHQIRIGQTLRLPGAGGAISAATSTYKIKPGDSLSVIAERAGMSQSQLMAMNGISSPNRIYAGQILKLKSGAPKQAASSPLPAKPVPVVAASIAPPPQPTVAAVEQVDEVSIVETEAVADEVDVELVAAEAIAEPLSAVPVQPVMAALSDPNDYEVATDNSIEVNAAETLGHYSDWLGLPTQRLRDINNLSFSTPVVVGRRVKLDFSQVSRQQFVVRRVAWHRELQDSFWLNYRVTNTTEHQIAPGESLWVLTNNRYKVPVWLVRQYNPDLDFGQLRTGTRIVIPHIESVEQEA